MRLLHCFLHTLLLLVFSHAAAAQHCPPVHESYLSEISLKQPKDGIKFRLEYTLRGGAGQDAFQAYLLAYLERDAARVPAPAPRDYIPTDGALVLHTQLITRNEDGAFDIEFQIEGDDLAKRMIAHRGLSEEDRLLSGGWGVYQGSVELI